MDKRIITYRFKLKNPPDGISLLRSVTEPHKI
jgi:hypothetical protein